MGFVPQPRVSRTAFGREYRADQTSHCRALHRALSPEWQLNRLITFPEDGLLDGLLSYKPMDHLSFSIMSVAVGQWSAGFTMPLRPSVSTSKESVAEQQLDSIVACL